MNKRISLDFNFRCFIVSQPSKCLKFMTFQEGCFVIHVEYKYLSEALETFYHHQFSKRSINKMIMMRHSVNNNTWAL